MPFVYADVDVNRAVEVAVKTAGWCLFDRLPILSGGAGVSRLSWSDLAEPLRRAMAEWRGLKLDVQKWSPTPSPPLSPRPRLLRRGRSLQAHHLARRRRVRAHQTSLRTRNRLTPSRTGVCLNHPRPWSWLSGSVALCPVLRCIVYSWTAPGQILPEPAPALRCQALVCRTLRFAACRLQALLQKGRHHP